jgi:hypothetical protein
VASRKQDQDQLIRNTGWKLCALNPCDTTKSALFLRSPCTQQ